MNIRKADPASETHADLAAGIAAYKAKDYVRAIECFERALESVHDDADAHNNLGLSCLALDRIDDAIDAFVLATHFRPGFAQAYYNLGAAELRAGNIGEARRCFERAVDLEADYAAAYNALGHVLVHHTGDFEAGAGHIRTALSLRPDDPDTLCNYSAVLAQEGRSEEAIAVCDRLLEPYPAMHEARLNRGLAQLRRGQFHTGWIDYEARKSAAGNYRPRRLTLPEWQGESVQGRKLLIYAEQGLGDQIMFASCIPDLLRQGANCQIECAPQLAALFARSFAPAQVIAQADDAALMRLANSAGAESQAALGSLPLYLRRRAEDFAPGAAYLRADTARNRYWKERLDELGPGLKVGISWAGGAASTRGASRSTQLSHWKPVLNESRCRFVSLQYGDAATQINDSPARITHWPEALVDYDETAALVAALDLVITVQTALVHLAGALGRPAWVLLRTASEWRYGEAGESMPWYSSVRLVRQLKADDWQSVFERVGRDLAGFRAG